MPSVTNYPSNMPTGIDAAQYVGASIGAQGSSWQQHASETWQAMPHPFRAFSNSVGFTNLAVLRMRSGARTITQGGWMGGDEVQKKYLDEPDSGFSGGMKGMVKREWHENFRPKSWYRGPTAQMFNPDVIGKENSWAFTKEGGVTKKGEFAGKVVDKIWGLNKLGITPEGGGLNHLWDPGLLRRWSAGADYAKIGSGSLNEAQRASFETFLDASKNTVMKETLAGTNITGDLAGQAVRLSSRGALSGRLTGAIEGMRGEVDPVLKSAASESARAGIEIGENIAKTAAKPLAEQGAKVAATDIGKRLAARAAVLAASYAAEGGPLNPIADVLAVVGLAKLGLDMGKLGADLVAKDTKDALTSFRGQIGKAPFGMGYRDTAAAATSRQRGVAAIQQSHLNFRSVLGFEGGQMAFHFNTYQ